MTDKNDTILRRGWSVFGKLVAGTRKGPKGDRVRLLKKLQKQFHLRFLDLSLLEQALTHRSYSHVTTRNRDASNERMEFLGDSVLGLSVSQFLYLQFPDRTEGTLSKMKSLLVSRKVLSEVSREIGLGEYLLLSGEESEMGGRDRDSILADSFEGVIGAVYLDQGYRAASRFIHETLLIRINDILKDEENTNYKSLLQEYVQSRRLSHPVYRVHAEDGPEHEKEFAVEVVVKGEVWGTGRGKNKKDAEQAAAREALENQRRKTSHGQRSSTAAPAPPATKAAAAPVRTSKWRTSTATSTGGRSTGEGSGEGREKEVESQHGIHASRDAHRVSRETRPREANDPRNEARRTERLEHEAARGENSPSERAERGAPVRGASDRGGSDLRTAGRETTGSSRSGRDAGRSERRSGSEFGRSPGSSGDLRRRRPPRVSEPGAASAETANPPEAPTWGTFGTVERDFGQSPERSGLSADFEDLDSGTSAASGGGLGGFDSPTERRSGPRRRGRRGGRGRSRPGVGPSGGIGNEESPSLSSPPPRLADAPSVGFESAPVSAQPPADRPSSFETRVISPRVVSVKIPDDSPGVFGKGATPPPETRAPAGEVRGATGVRESVGASSPADSAPFVARSAGSRHGRRPTPRASLASKTPPEGKNPAAPQGAPIPAPMPEPAVDVRASGSPTARGEEGGSGLDAGFSARRRKRASKPGPSGK